MRKFLPTLLLLLPLLLPAASAGPLRDQLRERLAERAAQQAGPVEPAVRLAPGQQITAPGRYEIHLRHDGIERMALLHVPRTWRKGEALPLVMALHGGGGGALYQASESRYGLIGKAESAGFLALFPNGVSGTKNGMLATWNAGNCCARARDENVDDVGFLKALVGDVAARTAVLPARTYAIGMSNGAMMAYRLACEAPEVFRGIMAVAGTDNTRQCTPRRPTPVLHVHARNDDRVLFEGGAGKAFRREAQVTDFVAVPDTISTWVRLNHADTAARRVLEVPGAFCDRHDAPADGAPVQLCVTETGGHSWPGAGKSRGEAPSQALRANDVMWDFFSAL